MSVRPVRTRRTEGGESTAHRSSSESTIRASSISMMRLVVTSVSMATRDVALPTTGFKLNGRRVAPERGPPLLAADNESVLAELGYDAQQRRALREDGVW